MSKERLATTSSKKIDPLDGKFARHLRIDGTVDIVPPFCYKSEPWEGARVSDHLGGTIDLQVRLNLGLGPL